MKLIVFGDIHGNYPAFEAAVYDALSTYGNEIDGFVFAGDYVGDFPDGPKVVELMQNIAKHNKTYIISGNRETGQVVPYLQAQKEGKEPDWSLDSTMGAALLSCRSLSQEQLEFLASLPETLVIREPGVRPLFVKHIMGINVSELEMVKREKMSIITAHTHETHEETKKGITLFNPGSVGLADEGIPGATYGILDSDEFGEWHLTIRDIEYDFNETLQSLKANDDLYNRCCGWGKALELSIASGINFTSLYSFEANRLTSIIEDAKEKGIEPDLSDLTSLKDVFSQGRYGNVNYDYSGLKDIILEDVGDAYVFGPAKVISSPKSKRMKPTKEIYDIALRNIQQLALTATREQIYDDRHSDIIKR